MILSRVIYLETTNLPKLKPVFISNFLVKVFNFEIKLVPNHLISKFHLDGKEFPLYH